MFSVFIGKLTLILEVGNVELLTSFAFELGVSRREQGAGRRSESPRQRRVLPGHDSHCSVLQPQPKPELHTGTNAEGR